jgi:SLT domain-containing protein
MEEYKKNEIKSTLNSVSNVKINVRILDDINYINDNNNNKQKHDSLIKKINQNGGFASLKDCLESVKLRH